MMGFSYRKFKLFSGFFLGLILCFCTSSYAGNGLYLGVGAGGQLDVLTRSSAVDTVIFNNGKLSDFASFTPTAILGYNYASKSGVYVGFEVGALALFGVNSSVARVVDMGLNITDLVSAAGVSGHAPFYENGDFSLGAIDLIGRFKFGFSKAVDQSVLSLYIIAGYRGRLINGSGNIGTDLSLAHAIEPGIGLSVKPAHSGIGWFLEASAPLFFNPSNISSTSLSSLSLSDVEKSFASGMLTVQLVTGITIGC